ncbi:MAG: efflux RND transporter periplasmic adaptor subunit [Gammaproteobacteria bacterium]|nr:efflux RND transporter periplasmic adaptor subunit [Gammaproteobacteria bacterium]
MNATLRFAGVAAALLLLGGVMAYFAGAFHDKIDTTAIAIAAKVPGADQIFTVRAIEEPVIEQASATVRAKDETVISSRITAAIAKVNVRAGDEVQADDVLIELDSRDLESRVAQQEQAARAAEARLAEARPGYERMQELVGRNLVSRADYDRALAALRAAEADLARARQAATEARTGLSYGTIRAPFAGRIIDRYADPGDTAVPARPLIRLYDPGLLRVEANLPESLAAAVSVGERLTTRIDAVDRELEARVEEIVPSADPGSRSVLVKAVLPTAAGIYPGMFGRLYIPRGTVRTAYVPPAAIRRVGQLEIVSVVTEHGIVRRQIRTGSLRHEGLVEVRSGLADGEVILRDAG